MIALLGLGLAAGCQDNTPAGQGVILDGKAADGKPVRVHKSWVISFSDTDPGPDALWVVVLHSAEAPKHYFELRVAGPRISEESTSGPEFDGPNTTFNAVGDIAHRAVGQAGIELVDTDTGAVVCAGAGTPDDAFSTFGFRNLHTDVEISFHCDDPRDVSTDLTMLTTGALNYGSYGAY